MVRSLSKIVFFLLISVSGFSQTGTDADNVQRPKDFKDDDQFKHFSKRREAVSKWQINQLKNGALLVRLKTNQMVIDALKKRGNADLAAHKENEAFIINKNIVRAYITAYKFSKVYFFLSNNSDTLLKGAKSGIFLDTNLVVDPNIKLTENYYLIAEEGISYDSSIGYVKEDSAKFVTEGGSTPVACVVVVKNKYYHQLHHPFPFRILHWGLSENTVKGYARTSSGQMITAEISKSYTSIKFLNYIANFNRNLNDYYKENKDYQVNDPDIKPFLY